MPLVAPDGEPGTGLGEMTTPDSAMERGWPATVIELVTGGRLGSNRILISRPSASCSL